jgi:hypothetical protein
MKLGYVYRGNWAHLSGVLHKPVPSVCVSACVSLLLLQDNSSVTCIAPFSDRQWLSKHVPMAMSTCNNRRIIGRVIFHAAHVLSKESLWVCLSIPILSLGTNMLKIFPQQQRIDRCTVFHAVHVISKGSRWSVLPRTSCYNFRIANMQLSETCK